VAAVCGIIREREPERSIYNWLCHQEWNGPLGEIAACAGNVMHRSAALAAAGGYREDVIAAEEDELCFRLRAASWRLWRLDREMAVHDAAMTRFSQWWRRSMRAGYAFASLGLFHAADCYDTYAPFSSAPRLVDNVHIKPDQHISTEELQERPSNRTSTLRLAYAGRIASEKSPFDWIEAVRAAAKSLKIEAVWFGDGPELGKARTAAAGLPIVFAGAKSHSVVLIELKRFDAFLFCHKTLKSPRCLIEALACGLPLIGYRSPYPEKLISGHGGYLLMQPRRLPQAPL
jgi:glycosyltransferase involved in cell wall biosynthesis